MEQSKLGARVGKFYPIPDDVIADRLNIKPINTLGMSTHDRKSALAKQQREFQAAMKAVKEFYSNPLDEADISVNTEYTNDNENIKEVEPIN